MYNYQTFRRDQLISQVYAKDKQQFKKNEMVREKSCPSLAHAHQKRVEGFILSAIDKPVPVSQHRNSLASFRNTAGPTLGSKGFYIRRESQSQRIQHSVKNNSELDQVPFTSASNHQFRDYPSTGKGLKFKPYTQNLRIKEYLDNQRLNYLPNSPSASKQEKLIKKATKDSNINIKVLNKSLHKSLLPVLHAKTYFKSVATLFSQIPQPAQKAELTYPSDQGAEQNEGERRSAKPKDHMSRKQNSKQVLIKCNMLNTLRS